MMHYQCLHLSRFLLTEATERSLLQRKHSRERKNKEGALATKPGGREVPLNTKP